MTFFNTLNKILFATLILTTSYNFADDIWFISPQPGQPIQNTVTIKIQPPFQNVPVNVIMEYDMGRDQVVWTGQLTAQNNYTLTVDVSKFKMGKYNIDAEYYINGKDFDGDVDVWIGTPNPNGQYYPQQ